MSLDNRCNDVKEAWNSIQSYFTIKRIIPELAEALCIAYRRDVYYAIDTTLVYMRASKAWEFLTAPTGTTPREDPTEPHGNPTKLQTD